MTRRQSGTRALRPRGTGGGDPVGVTWAVTLAEASVATLALLAAAATGEVVLVAFAAPLVVALTIGLVWPHPEAPSVTTSVEPLVVGTGEAVLVSLEVVADEAQSVVVELDLPARARALGSSRWLASLRPGRPETLSCEISLELPGRYRLGTARLVSGRAPLLVVRSRCTGQPYIAEARPTAARTGLLARSERVRVLAGDRVSPLAGEGIEFADVREESAAVTSRRVNWRATARRQVTCVNVFHPERSTDVVLLVDTFSPSALAGVISAALNAAEAYLSRHDRLAVVCFGGVLDWVEPGTGVMHLERVRRALLESESFFSYAWKTADIIPRRLLPSGAFVLALSPLVDPRFSAALVELRSRGVDVATIEVRPGSTQERLRRTPSGALAARIVELEHEELRFRLASWGIPVAELPPSGSLGLALTQLAQIRRKASRSGRPATRR